MANGDIASAAGVFTPVSSAADIRNGYDDINRLADSVAGLVGAGGWALSTGVISPASGFGSVMDPNGLAAGSTTTPAGAAGGAKLLRPYVGVAAYAYVLSVRLTRTGASLAAATTSGNIADVTAFTMSPSFRPAGARQFVFSTGTYDGVGQINPDGTAVLKTLSPNAVIATGDLIQFDAYVPM